MNLSTALPIIAQVSRTVSRAMDRITGDRTDYPHIVALGVQQALRQHRIESMVVYGKAAWIEVLEDSRVTWGGYWGDQLWIWVETQFGEIADINVSAAHRKRVPSRTNALYSPPMLWSVDIPKFYRYRSEGAAEFELAHDHEKRYWHALSREVAEKCVQDRLELSSPEFPNEPILCPGRQLLDDTDSTLKHFDRALSVHGIPKAPF